MEERFLKITNTAYKVLDFFPEHDPLKDKAKEKALAILSALGGSASGGENSIKEDIDVFISYLKIAKAQRWIDNINFLILIKEYEAIKREILLQIPGIRYPASALSSLRGGSQADEAIPAIESKTNFEIASTPTAVGSRNDSKGLQQELTERQKRILDMLNEKEKAQVSDIIKVLPNITKRTIRRDLDGLLEMGKVVRVGEWNQIFYKITDNNDRTVILS
jgi:hypothetical protein